MMMPCFITGAYAFSTTRVSEFVCALRRMRVPESAAIPCMVVIRFFPTIGRDYRRIRDAMALRFCLRPTRAAAASGPVAGVRAGSAVDERDDRLA
ncbi:energy-coupling factor transporter transmembrane component T [Bifidobacterium bifidum]|uniref:energy-coupling factor transporter transmembrane component T n=1 Tax=Bifidobacterium bifidum TaxID=1681 RepID=UPI003CFFF684